MESFDPAVAARALRTRYIGRQLEHHRVIGSTNARALELGGPPGLVIVADEQTDGRGRRGRRWHAPAGCGLLVSVVLEPLPVAAAALITFAAGIATCEVVRQLGPDAHLKWPNDVLVGRRKIAGILCESRATGSTFGPVVVGIGLNVNQLGEGDLEPGATSCRFETGSAHPLEQILAELLYRLEPVVAAVAGGDVRSVVARWTELSRLHHGSVVRVERDADVLLGITDGIDDDGALRVVHAGAVHRVVGGGVTFL